MALGDGIRRNVATVSDAERGLLRDAIIALNKPPYIFSGSRTDSPAAGGVTYWFKQDEIHQSTHVHGGLAFLPWHREMCNRFEQMLRLVNPQLSLHYWDWTTDGHELFVPEFMGDWHGYVNQPWLGAGFYDPNADPHRGEPFDPNMRAADPPQSLARDKQGGLPGVTPDGSHWPTDDEILAQTTFWEMTALMDKAHRLAHWYIGGDIGFISTGGTFGEGHKSFRDPFVFLLHSNVDRLFTRWQTDPAFPDRLEANGLYGSVKDNIEILAQVEPWSSGNPTDSAGITHFIRPWAEFGRGEPHTYRDLSVVFPPTYDDTPDPGLNRIAMDHLQMLAADNSSGADAETRGLANAITQCRRDCWTLENLFLLNVPLIDVHPLFLGRVRIQKRVLRQLVSHRSWKGGMLPAGLVSQWQNWERHAVQSTFEPPWSAIDSPWLTTIHPPSPMPPWQIMPPMDPNALPSSFGPVALNVNGALELAVSSTSGRIDHIAQRPPPLGWTSWLLLSNDVVAAGLPAIAQNLDGRLEIWVRDQSGAIWHIWQLAPSGAWWGWEQAGSGFSSSPAVGRNATGTLEVFAITNSGQLQHLMQAVPNGGWGQWETLASNVTGDPAVAQNANGALDVFALMGTRAMGHMWQTAGGAWSDWHDLGGNFSGSPAAGVNMDGRIEIFAVDNNGALSHTLETAPGPLWADWTAIPGDGMTGVAAIAQNRDGHLEVFARNKTGTILHTWQLEPGGTWGSWTTLGTTLSANFTDGPWVGVNTDGRLEVFGLAGADGTLQHAWQVIAGGQWSGWDSLGKPPV